MTRGEKQLVTDALIELRATRQVYAYQRTSYVETSMNLDGMIEGALKAQDLLDFALRYESWRSTDAEIAAENAKDVPVIQRDRQPAVEQFG